ncbi:fucose isomerase [Anaerolentibacter hominis]|uniref:L-fucose/L-arabinose isomerase family protein n=1 Tax=Anaerolentibacter hominis TaxID=3079009 RepID=UPI0031B8905C
MLDCFTKRRTVKIGFAPIRRNPHNGPNFNLEEAILYKKEIEKALGEYDVELVTIDDTTEDGLLFCVQDAERVAKKFISEEVDGVFIPHVNFGCEEAAARLCKMVGKPVLLWGPQDDIKPDGYRYRDSQCGLFATSKILNLYGVPFSYIVNCEVTAAEFKEGFEKFIGVCSVIKAATHMRIGQISVRPGPFFSVKYNEMELLTKFGIEIVPIAMSDLKFMFDNYMKENAAKVDEEAAVMKKTHNFIDVTDEQVRTIVGLKRTIEEWALKENLNGVATMCWKPMTDTFGISACFILSEICDDGLPCICETDVHGAIGAVLTLAAARYTTPMFLADLTIRNPENKNSELLWHCGVFAKSLAREDSTLNVGVHHGRPAGAVGQWQLKKGDLNIVRFDGFSNDYSMFLGRAKAIDGPYTKGSYVWIEVDDWDKWEKKLIYGPYIHHCVGIYADVLPILEEACRYLPVKADLV